MRISVVVAQVAVTWNVDTNLSTLRDILDEALTGDVVVLPEGLLSGYGDDLARLDDVDPAAIHHAVARVERLARRKRVHVFCGSLLPEDGGGWCNAGLFFSADGGRHVYRKINLAMHERGRLRPGDELPTFAIPQPAARSLPVIGE